MNHRSPCACLETLEPRRLFTGIFFAHHRLSLIGSVSSPNTITVGLTPGGSSVVAEVIVHTPRGDVDYTNTYSLSDGIGVVVIRGGADNDLITVDQTNGSFPIRVGVSAGNGNDTVMGGDEPDYILAGKGSDYVDGGAGDDVLLGQLGDDTLIGGPGNDYLNGGAGHDMMLGGDGNDTLNDARGPDTILGGAGNNTFRIHSLQRDSDNDYDKTKDKLRIITAPDDNSDNNTSLLTSLFPILSIL